MFTKALIAGLPTQGSNIYYVRIPLFEDTTGDIITYKALCCYSPGIYGGLNIGDCVYVTFEDGKLNIPVIVGKLYTTEKDDYAKGYFNNLNVTENAQLPMSTTFGNGMSINNLYNTMQYMSSVVDQCPFSVNDIYQSTLNTDPALKWMGTSWSNVGQTTTSTGSIIYNWRRDS